jgi:hypothetical protein
VEWAEDELAEVVTAELWVGSMRCGCWCDCCGCGGWCGGSLLLACVSLPYGRRPISFSFCTRASGDCTDAGVAAGRGCELVRESAVGCGDTDEDGAAGDDACNTA